MSHNDTTHEGLLYNWPRKNRRKCNLKTLTEDLVGFAKLEILEESH